MVQRAVRALTRSDPRSVLFKGALGVGKSRVVDEIVLALESASTPVRRVAATTATQTVPFGAVAHLLPVDLAHGDDPRVVIAAVRDALALDEERAVLVVDDVPLLDAATSTVLANLVAAGSVTLLASARVDSSIPDSLVSLLLGEKVDLFEVEPLDEMGVETLLHLALGAPVDGATVLALGQRSAGNPLFLRELTRVAVEQGALVLTNGVWRLNRDLPRSPRLAELVEAGLDNIEGGARRALDLLAMCEPVQLDELETFATIEDLISLEERGLLRVEDRSGSFVAWLGHPMHGEAIRIGMSSLRLRQVLRDHVDWVEGHGPLSSTERLRCALWRLDAGLGADDESLMEGAMLARTAGDFPAMARMTRAAFESSRSLVAGLFLAESLFALGRWPEFRTLLPELEALEAAEPTRHYLGALLVNKSILRSWVDGDPAEPRRVMRAALERDLDPYSRTLIRADLVWLAVNDCDVDLACEVVFGSADLSRDEQAAALPDIAPELARPFVLVLGFMGRTAAATIVADGANRGSALGDLDGMGRAAWEAGHAYVALERGEVADAIERSERGYEAAAISHNLYAESWFALILGRAHLLAGRVRSAGLWFARARALGADADTDAIVVPALTGLTIVNAVLPEPEFVLDADELAVEHHGFSYLFPRASRTIWAAVSAGNLEEARSIALASAASAFAADHGALAMAHLHDAARLGGADAALVILDGATVETESELVIARAVHIRALAARDVAGLVDAAERFEGLGLRLFAAEALTTAADLSRAAGRQRDASGFSVWANRLLEDCQGAVTPALVTNTEAVVPLTDREREVAFLAAQGMASKEIGESLFLSRRTVDNHLSHVYEKLGIRNRSQLPDALGINVNGSGIVSSGRPG